MYLYICTYVYMYLYLYIPIYNSMYTCRRASLTLVRNTMVCESGEMTIGGGLEGKGEGGRAEGEGRCQKSVHTVQAHNHDITARTAPSITLRDGVHRTHGSRARASPAPARATRHTCTSDWRQGRTVRVPHGQSKLWQTCGRHSVCLGSVMPQHSWISVTEA